MRTRAAAALLAALLAACGGDPDPTPEESGPCAGLSGGRAYDARSYALDARYDWGTGLLTATEELTLALCPRVSGTIVLDSGVSVSSVTAGGQALGFAEDPDAETLSVNLGALAGSTEPITLTVAYQVAGSEALGATTSDAADPVRTRVVFSDSEPRGGHLWLVQKDDPSDPARFSITLEVGPGEDAVANGVRVLDEPIAGGRRIGYALDVPVATYLMAFAAGELDHAERTYTSLAAGGREIPLALWWRRGLAVAPDDTFDAIEGAMAVFEDRLGPYPFDRYSTVLLPPPFGGGMENATITFNGESSSTGWVSDGLNAHELAHHWFGDWVTMATYDDVWVKEGMATLLASESQRAARDAEGRGRLMGIDFDFDPDHAIVDPGLTGIAKYTSGPYQRAAALITQVRAIVGEDTFWSSCRAFLAAHANGSATGEEFVRAFSPHLDEATIARVLAQLPKKGVPAWTVSTAGVAGGTLVTLDVSDPGGALIAPRTLTTVTGAGAVTEHALVAGTPLEVTVPWGGYLALDERDLLAYWDVDGALAWLLLPDETGPGSVDEFLARSAAQQERALAFDVPGMGADELPGFLAGLDSVYARRYALAGACARYAANGAAWVAALTAALDAPPVTRFQAGLRSCGLEVGAAFEAELLALEAEPAPADLARLEYLLSFRYGPDGLAAIQRLSTGAPTRELRAIAAGRLSLEPALRNGGPPAPERDGRVDEGKAGRRAPLAR